MTVGTWVRLFLTILMFSGGTAVSLAQDESNPAAETPTGTGTASSEEPVEAPELPRIVNIDDFKPPADQLMREAVDLQTASNPARAAAVFADLLRYHPETSYKEEVVFRLAECYRALGRYKESRQMLDLLRSEFPKGKWRFPGSLLAGEMWFSEKEWEKARGHFKTAAGSPKSELKARALFLWAVCSAQLKELKEARPALERLSKIEKDNPHRDFAFLKLGELTMQGSEPNGGKQISEAELEKAEGYFKKALSLTQSADLRAEAAVRVGNLVYGKQRYSDAVAFYEMVRKLDAPKVWRELSHMGLLQALFAKKQYGEVLRVYNEVKPEFPEGLRATVFFIVGESYRLTEKADDALRTYAMVLTEFPKSPLAQASLWARVMVFQKLGDDRASEEAGKYLAKYPEAPEALRARLIRADAAFRKKLFPTAGPMYADLLKSEKALRALSTDTFRQVLLRAGMCAYVAEDFSRSVSLLERFLKEKNERKEQAQALWLLGQAYLATKQPEPAAQSLQKLASEHPQFGEREALLWKLAYVYGNLEQFAAMKRTLLLLLAEFPVDLKKGELYYWLAIASEKLGEPKEAFEFWGKARLVDAESYFEQATRFRLNYALKESRGGGTSQDSDGAASARALELLAQEVGAYDEWWAKNSKAERLAPEIYEWMAQQYEIRGDAESAEMQYRKVLALEPKEAQKKRAQLKLARLMSTEARHGAAVREWELFREWFPDDADRNEVLVPLAEAYLGSANYEKARSLAEQILRQNPEGGFNSRGRILLGDLEMAQGEYAKAGKVFRTVALLALDETYAPMALARAEKAFRRAGMEKEADKALLQLRKEFPKYKPEPEDS